VLIISRHQKLSLKLDLTTRLRFGHRSAKRLSSGVGLSRSLIVKGPSNEPDIDTDADAIVGDDAQNCCTEILPAPDQWRPPSNANLVSRLDATLPDYTHERQQAPKPAMKNYLKLFL
jgi:hypothetical protein